MKRLFLHNLKTTLAGLFGGIVFIAPQIQNCLNGAPCDFKQIAAGLALTLLGLVSKDHDTTGGTKSSN